MAYLVKFLRHECAQLNSLESRFGRFVINAAIQFVLKVIGKYLTSRYLVWGARFTIGCYQNLLRFLLLSDSLFTFRRFRSSRYLVCSILGPCLNCPPTIRLDQTLRLDCPNWNVEPCTIRGIILQCMPLPMTKNGVSQYNVVLPAKKGGGGNHIKVYPLVKIGKKPTF